jgi:membrane-associated protein
MNELVTWLLDTVRDVDPVARTLVAGVAMMLESSVLVGLIVPGDTIVIAAGTAVASWWEGAVLVLVLVVGSLVGESIGFTLGRFFGARIRRSRLGARIGEQNWVRAEQYLKRRGGVAIFFSRFLPVVHALVPLTVGANGFSFRRFLCWSAPAAALWASMYVGASAATAGTFRELSGTIDYAGYLFVAAIAIGFALMLLTRKLLRRVGRSRLEGSDGGE